MLPHRRRRPLWKYRINQKERRGSKRNYAAIRAKSAGLLAENINTNTQLSFEASRGRIDELVKHWYNIRVALIQTTNIDANEELVGMSFL